MRVLITGARGKTGTPLAQLLTKRHDIAVLAGSSDPASVTLSDVTPTAFSWDSPSDWPAATDGIDALYVVRPDREDAPGLVADLLRLTSETARVVLLSEQDVDFHAPSGWGMQVEDAVRASGRSWVILRPSWFMQAFTDDRLFRGSLAAGTLDFPSGGARVAWIDARDIAAVAERAVLDEELAGTVQELSGPVAYTLPETAQALSAVIGRQVDYHDVPVDVLVEGLEGFDRDAFTTIFERVRAGVFGTVTDGVPRVTGRPARPFEAFLAEHAAVLSEASAQGAL